MIQLFKPAVGKEELDEIKKCFDTGWLGLGPKTAEFEKRFADYIGVKHAIGTNSCTAALDLALKAFDITSGEVIVPAMTFVSTAHAALYNGAKPVFADITKDTLCMDPEDVNEKITRRTKAIIPVHYAGHPCNMTALNDIVEGKNIKIIEDAAEAVGSEFIGRKCGSLSDIACFSFDAKKTLTTANGGMITTNDDSLIEKLRQLRWYGVSEDTWQRTRGDKPWYYEIRSLGHKFNMNDTQAAMGIAQLNKLPFFIKRRQEIVERYIKNLSNLKWLRLPEKKGWANVVWWLFLIRLSERDEFVKHMESNGIGMGVHFIPVHHHPYYKKKYKVKLPVTDMMAKRICDLPLFTDMTNNDVDKICDIVKQFKAGVGDWGGM